MRALVLNKPMNFTYEDRPMPQCLPEQLVVKVDAVCICGSDIHAIGGRQPLFSFPRVIGHEVAGTVCQVGKGVEGFSAGDKVCLMPCVPCSTCRACQKGKTNTCNHLELYGVHRDGGLQEYLAAPAANWMKAPQNASPEELSMVEPLTIGAHAVAKLGLQTGDRVLIIGAGPIGVSCAVNAQTYGAQVTLCDTNPLRRKFVKDRFNLAILDPLDYNYSEEIEETTEGNLFDAVIDTTAAKAVMGQDWKWIAHGGKIVFVGICNGVLELEGLPFHMREPSLFVTRNSTRTDYERVLDCWQKGMLNPGLFVTHTVPFAESLSVLPAWTNPAAGVFKGVVRFPD